MKPPILEMFCIALLAGVLHAGCRETTTSSDSHDAGPAFCPGYQPANGEFYDECCLIDDPCGWAEDHVCDCGEHCDWDTDDCSMHWCEGYTGWNECCQDSNPCAWENDGFCDCDGYCEWEVGNDCEEPTDAS
jgi:hypothetical protein